MKLQKQIDQLIAQQASEWIEVLKTGGDEERAAFVEWLCESRKHVAEFLAMTVVDDELKQSVFKDLVDKDRLAKRVSPDVIAIGDHRGSVKPTTPAQSDQPSRWRWQIAVAAGLSTMALLLTLILTNTSTDQNLTTNNTEQRAVELADGSVVLLNTDSRIDVRLDAKSRELKLLGGEALFKVANDPQRPFVVHIGDMRVQALGTQFNVNAREATAVVSVLEGKVLVSSISTGDGTVFGAGETATLQLGGSVDRIARSNAADAAEWRQRRLVFKRTPLEDVIAKFNSYNVTPKLRLEGIDGHSRNYSMIFDAEDPASFADFLAKEGDLSIERREHEVVIRER